jgi:hypothetical protein
VPRDSGDRDFYDPDVPTDADPSPLRRVILDQAFEPGGAIVLLYTSATLDGADGASGDDHPAPRAVEATAVELELDPVPPDLFTPDAYLLQSALGERLLADDA